MADKLEIFSRTLTNCGQRPLLSLTDQRPEQRAIDRVYDACVRYMLEAANWKFASRSDELQTSDTTTAQFGYTYVYEEPTDFVRIIEISDNNRFRPTLGDYKRENGFFLADCQPLYLHYVSNDTQYGLNTGRWTASFCDALVDELSVRTIPFLSGANVPKIEALRKAAKRSFYLSKQRDAYGDAMGHLPAGRLVRSRAGFGRINNMNRDRYQ